MHISQFRVQNFKSFRDVTFHFDEKLNLLTAENNGGKTTVLEALALWHECYVKLLQEITENTSTKYNKGQYVLGNKDGILLPLQNIVNVRSANYADIFHHKASDLQILFTATLSHENKTLTIPFYIEKTTNEINYRIGLLDFDSFDFDLLNDTDFVFKNPELFINSVFAMPVGSILKEEEIIRPASIRRYVSIRNSREVLRNRILDLRNRFEDDYNAFIADLTLIRNEKYFPLSKI